MPKILTIETIMFIHRDVTHENEKWVTPKRFCCFNLLKNHIHT